MSWTATPNIDWQRRTHSIDIALALLLQQAEKAHVEYERSSAAPKMTWPEFYGHFIADLLFSAGLEIREVSR